jgi:putative ABC transport system permease protein
MLLNALKIAWKVLLRHPFYTFITLFGISLTLTVLMVLTSFLDHLLAPHYPEHKRDRLLYISRVAEKDSLEQSSRIMPASYHFLKTYAKTLKTPEKVGIATLFAYANAYVNGKRISLQTKFTDADFWDVTDFEFLEGKPYNAQTIAQGQQVAVITDDLKKQYFDDETAPAVGKTMEVDNGRYRIIGVVRAAPVTRPMTAADVYFPYTVPKSNYQGSGLTGNFVGLVLARTPADLPAIKAEFNDAVGRIPVPQVEDGWKFYVLDVKANRYLEDFIRTFNGKATDAIFFSVVGLFMLLFMALPAINLVNVNVSRIMERASEIGIRKAFGAPARTLVWQFVVENLFITFLGGIIALGLSGLIIGFINRSGWIFRADLTINFTVFAVSLLVCVVFGLLSGVAPAFRMAKLPIAEALKQS